jgi:hypothetical protein
MTVADNIKPYPEAATYEVWNKAKTTSVGDKVSTGLGKALSKARGDYAVIDWKKLDVKRYEAAHGKITTAAAADVARRGAEMHMKMFLAPAIKSLVAAKAKATTVGKNVVISKKRNAAAKAAAAALDEPIRVLKAIHLQDFDAVSERLKLG